MTTPLAILTAILNSFWQAAALAGLVWLGLRWVRVNAATRYVIWWAVLAVVIVLPFAPRFTERWLRPRVTPAMSQPVNAAPEGGLYLPAADVDRIPAIVTLPEKSGARWPLAIFWIWGVVFLCRLGRVGQSYFYLRRVKRNAVLSNIPLSEVGRSARVLVSRDIGSPMAVGFLHPAVILPEGLSDRISREDLDQILLHEVAHLARRDDWLNLLARLLAAVLSLHPVAWWVLREIEYEREAACDDWVVARTGAARAYAESLAQMVELRWQRDRARYAEVALASGVFGRGSRIGDRIEMLLRRGREFSPCVSFGRVVAGVVGLCCLAAAGTFAPRWIAFAKAPMLRQIAAPPLVAALPVQKQFEPQPPLVAQAAGTPAATTAVPRKAPAPEFEVASIRPALFPSAAYKAGFYAAASAGCFVREVSISGTLVSLHMDSICDLIGFAYALKGFQILGAPALREVSGRDEAMALAEEEPSFYYDIDARAPGAGTPTQDDVRAMLRTLLADRFKLVVYHETRNLAYYALVVGRRGAKLTPSEEGCAPRAAASANGVLHVCKRTIDQLIVSLSRFSERPVVDETGLTGTFDYDIRPFSAADAISVYQEQLGLSLEPRKGPIDVLVVDHVEAPSTN